MGRGGGPRANPLRSLHEHAHEVYATSWNLAGARDTFLTASWDDTIKLWSIDRGESCERSPTRILRLRRRVESHHADVFASASGDCLLKIWDLRQPHATLSVPVHDYEALCCDWNKWNDCVSPRERGQVGSVVGYSKPISRVTDARRTRLRGEKGEVFAARGEYRVHVFVRHDRGDVGLEIADAAVETMGASHRVCRRFGHVVSH